MCFREFIENLENVEKLLLEFNNTDSLQPKEKVWSAKKSDILQTWKTLRPDTPISITPLSDTNIGTSNKSTYGEDGIRLTGSWSFISSVLSKIKDLIYYENPQTKLRLILRSINKGRGVRPERNNFVFYLNLEKRGGSKS